MYIENLTSAPIHVPFISDKGTPVRDSLGQERTLELVPMADLKGPKRGTEVDKVEWARTAKHPVVKAMLDAGDLREIS